MTITAKTFVEASQLTTGATTKYTATSVVGIIDKATCTNVSVAAATLTVYLVASGGTAGPANATVYQKTIAAGYADTLPELVGHILNAGDFLSALASAATALNLRVSGREVS